MRSLPPSSTPLSTTSRIVYYDPSILSFLVIPTFQAYSQAFEPTVSPFQNAFLSDLLRTSYFWSFRSQFKGLLLREAFPDQEASDLPVLCIIQCIIGCSLFSRSFNLFIAGIALTYLFPCILIYLHTCQLVDTG